jgi:PEP-CTERM motif
LAIVAKNSRKIVLESMKIIIRILFLTVTAVLFFAVSASANTLCVPLGSYQLASTCNPSGFKIYGDAASNQSVGTTQGLITGNSFQVGFDNNSSATDVLILAVFSSDAVGGTLNGISFTQLPGDPFGASENGAIASTFAGLGFPSSPVAYGWLDLGQGVTSGNKLTVNMSGVASGTALYAEAVDPFSAVIATMSVCDTFKNGKCTKSHMIDISRTRNQIDHINANSEAGITEFAPPRQTPEPSGILLLGFGVVALALFRRN